MTEDEFIRQYVSRETIDKLKILEELLVKWQRQINLISNETVNNIWSRHILDSLQLIRYIPAGSNVVDVGSGGGFPGLVLAITNSYSVTCVDADFRKCCFLQTVVDYLGIRTTILNSRIEDATEQIRDVDVITARGFSSLRNILKIQKMYTRKGVYLKGSKVLQEIKEAEEKERFKFDLYDSITDVNGRILVVEL